MDSFNDDFVPLKFENMHVPAFQLGPIVFKTLRSIEMTFKKWKSVKTRIVP